MSERLVRLPEVETRVGLKKTAIYQKIKAGEFPAPTKIGYAARWPESAINQWIADRIADSDPTL